MEHAEARGINWQEKATEWSQRPIGWEGTSQGLMQPQLLVGGGSRDALSPENTFPAGYLKESSGWQRLGFPPANH